MVKLYRKQGKLITLINDVIFKPAVAVIENIAIKPAGLETIKCDCGKQAINWLFNSLTNKRKHTCDSLKCIQKAIKTIR